MSIGVGYDEFWKLTPRILSVYIKAHKQKLKEIDRMNWMLGMYVCSAVSVALDGGFNGQKAKTEYIKEPFMNDPDYGLTQEEIDERELQKMLMYEDEFIRRDKAKGLKQI